MKIICYFFTLLAFSAFSLEDKLEPIIYADISDSAQDSAVSFSGVRVLLGFGLARPKFSASINESKNYTYNSMNLFCLSTGIEYSKVFLKGFSLAADVCFDVSKKVKRTGDWNTLNREYESQRGSFRNDKKSSLESDAIYPNICLKGGYVFHTYKSMVFAKFGIAKMGSTYTYKQGSSKVCSINIKNYVPSLGFGIERKINTKCGILLEANLLIRGSAKSSQDEISHKTRINRTDIRLMGTCSIFDK